jgi:hypothetical protein
VASPQDAPAARYVFQTVHVQLRLRVEFVDEGLHRFMERRQKRMSLREMRRG